MAKIAPVLRRLQVETRVASEPLARALMLVYLVDWKAALDLGGVVTDAEWTRAAWGPFSADVVIAMTQVRYRPPQFSPSSRPQELELRQVALIDDVKSRYSTISTEDLSKLVLSTYPMIYSTAKDVLKLPEMAEIYRRDFQKARDRASAWSPIASPGPIKLHG